MLMYAYNFAYIVAYNPTYFTHVVYALSYDYNSVISPSTKVRTSWPPTHNVQVEIGWSGSKCKWWCD